MPVLVGAALFACDTEPARRPDVVLLIVDTLRADHLGLYGYERPTSPALDRFAESAIVFDRVLAPSSWTLPSVASLMTGTYPTVHGLRAQEGSVSTRLRDGLTTLPEAFSASGYRTVAVVGNPWLTTTGGGLTDGYDEFEKMDMSSADVLHAFARTALEADDTRPTFLYLHYMDVHGPYNALKGNEDLGPVPAAYERVLTADERGRILRYFKIRGAKRLDDYVEAYDQGIRRWDQSFGEFMDWLEQSGRLEHTVVLVTSDHGEEFLEHGAWNHGLTLFQEQLSVPFLVHVPGAPKRRVSDRPISLIDVGPTLLTLAGVEPPTTMLGLDVLADEFDALRPVFSETDIALGKLEVVAPQRAMLRGMRKVLTRPKKQLGPESSAETESICFDLESDPGELRPMKSGASNEGCDGTAFDELAAWEREMQKLAEQLGEAESYELSPEETRKLQALGYGE